MCVNAAPAKSATAALAKSTPATLAMTGKARQLADMIGDRNAKRMMSFCPQSCLADGSLLSSIPTLRDEYGISNDGLVTFMGNSVAARLDDKAFWAGLSRLNEFGISGDRLVAFMSNSVAVRLDDDDFWAGLSRLGEFNITGDGLVTFMTGSVATRLGDEEFWSGLSRLGEFGISGDRLVRFMGDSVATRLGDESFWAGLSRLVDLGISGDQLVAFTSNSVAARLGDEEFWVGLSRLNEFGISGDRLVTLMTGSVATRLDDDDFMEGLSSLCSELSPPVVVDMLKNNNPFASRVTIAYARSILNIARHLDSHGFSGAKTLKALVGKTPLVGKVSALETILLSANTRESIEAALKPFRGSYAHKRAIAATL